MALDHQKALETLEEAYKSAPEPEKQAALGQILEKYPLLYGYWLKYLEDPATPRETWLGALGVCPAIELYQQFFKVFPNNLEDYELAIEQVGHYFLAAPIWDLYLAHPSVSRKEALEKATKMPLYDYAKYFGQAKEALGKDLTAEGQAMAEEIGQRWKYESKIQRPYFHVLPLEEADIDNWNNYLDYQELKPGDAAIALYRRCLISTALYPQFWRRYLHYVGRFAPQLLEKVYEDAKLYIQHTPEFSPFSILYASYLELAGRPTDAEKVLGSLKDTTALRDFEHRNGGAPVNPSLEDARALWAQKKIDKHKYLAILKSNGQLSEFFEVDVIVNGPPDAARSMRKIQAPDRD